MPLINAVEDTGKFASTILAEYEKYEGKTFCAATAPYSLEQIAAILSQAIGKIVICKQVPLEEFKKSLSFPLSDVFVDYFSYQEKFG